MPLGEFDLIERFFRRGQRRAMTCCSASATTQRCSRCHPARRSSRPPIRWSRAGISWPARRAESVGHQALAVNLSDLAAMGAEPAWALLSLSLPDADAAWLERFADGLFALAGRHGVALVGGDTVRGPRVVTITALGFVPPRPALRRGGARPGDVLYVSGWPGEAAAGSRCAAIRRAGDSSDPLRAPLPATRSRASRWAARCAVAPPRRWTSRTACSATSASCARRAASARGSISSGCRSRPSSRDAHARRQCERFALCGGDDYELLFTLPPRRRGAGRG